MWCYRYDADCNDIDCELFFLTCEFREKECDCDECKMNRENHQIK